MKTNMKKADENNDPNAMSVTMCILFRIVNNNSFAKNFCPNFSKL